MTDSKNKFCCADKINLYEMCLDCYNAFFTDSEFAPEWAVRDEYLDGVPRKYMNLVCECGSETAGGSTHSHWCPKGKKE